MTNTDQLVSVIVPFYNAEKYLETAIESVLRQTYGNWELILVNDGSADESPLIASKYVDNKKIFLLEHPGKENKGVSASRTLAISQSKGEFISFLDADDFYSPQKIEKNIKVLQQFPETVLVHSSANSIDETSASGNYFYEFKYENTGHPYFFLEGDFLQKNHICNSSVMARSESIKRINKAFTHLFQYEDWINWILLAQHGSFYYIDEPLCTYRFHDTSSTTFLLNKPLAFLYAKLEMLFILLHRVATSETKQKIEEELKDHLEKMFLFYEPTVLNDGDLATRRETQRELKTTGKIWSTIKDMFGRK